jgi:hypothetical protein
MDRFGDFVRKYRPGDIAERGFSFQATRFPFRFVNGKRGTGNERLL